MITEPRSLREPKCWASETQPAKHSLLVAGTEGKGFCLLIPAWGRQSTARDRKIVGDSSLSHFQRGFS